MRPVDLVRLGALAAIRGVVTPTVAANILGLALLGSAIAYALYYRLVADVGPTNA